MCVLYKWCVAPVHDCDSSRGRESTMLRISVNCNGKV